jgi:hypothetical protein
MPVFSTAFLPPPVFVSELLKASDAVVDLHEHFIKQTHRNRCRILTANGPMNLVIPVQKSAAKEMKDIRISYSEKWQRQQAQAILSAYRNAPYYEHYEEDFLQLFLRQEEFLADYNEVLWQWMWKVLDVRPVYSFSEHYIEDTEDDFRGVDFCGELHRRKVIPYKQVFAHKFSFVPHLSMIDLLFNKGPEAFAYI